jgi:hypothetical protein
MGEFGWRRPYVLFLICLNFSHAKHSLPNQPFPPPSPLASKDCHSLTRSLNHAVEKYNPCVTSVGAPVQFQGLDDMHPQWQREPTSHLKLDFVYGYQGASCWDQDLFGPGPGQDNLYFLQVCLERDPRDHRVRRESRAQCYPISYCCRMKRCANFGRLGRRCAHHV